MSELSPNETALIVPQLDLHSALAQHRLYLDVCKKLLDEDDYAVIRGRKHRKRSGWAKLRKAFFITTEIRTERRVEIGDDWGYAVTVRATAPSGRFEEADGLCMASELIKVGMEPTEHNVRSKALTRAKNRASSDILGAGVISAEEVRMNSVHWIDNPDTRKAFWAFAKATLKLRELQVYKALGVERIHDFTGTMKEAKKLLEEYAIG